MTALSNIPPQAVLPLEAYDQAELERAADRAGQTLAQIDCSKDRSPRDVMKSIAGALKFPPHFGANLDALYDCLTDLKPDAGPDAVAPGFVVIMRDLPVTEQFDAEQRDRLLDVFRDAADHYYDENLAFRVFYSLARSPS